MTEPEIVYRFTPPFEGAFLHGVPRRDLTKKDVDRLTGQERADAFSPHPVTGATLYTPTDEYAETLRVRNEERAKASEAAEAEFEAQLPKWFTTKRDKLAERGIVIPMMQDGETQKEFESRVDENGVATLHADGSTSPDLGIQMGGVIETGDSDPDQDGAE